MKMTDRQYRSLFNIICVMILALMIIGIGYAYEFGIEPPKEKETQAKKLSYESELTIETLPLFVPIEETIETESEETEIITESSKTTEKETEKIETMILTSTETTIQKEEFPWYTSDYELLARLLWAEARGESYEGQLAVVEVVFNRVGSPNFPGTVYEVIYESGQFTTATSLECVTPTQMQYDVVTAALKGERVLNNDNCVYFSRGGCCGTYYTTIGNHVFGCE